MKNQYEKALIVMSGAFGLWLNQESAGAAKFELERMLHNLQGRLSADDDSKILLIEMFSLIQAVRWKMIRKNFGCCPSISLIVKNRLEAGKNHNYEPGGRQPGYLPDIIKLIPITFIMVMKRNY